MSDEIAKIYPRDEGKAELLTPIQLREEFHRVLDLSTRLEWAIETATEAVLLGMSLAGVARQLGVSTKNMIDWFKYAQRGDEPYVTFCHALADAYAELERDLAEDLMNNRSKGTFFQNTLDILKRRFPDDWADTPSGPRAVNVAASGQVVVHIPSNGREA